jgi:hypothetical protein
MDGVLKVHVAELYLPWVFVLVMPSIYHKCVYESVYFERFKFFLSRIFPRYLKFLSHGNPFLVS